MLPEKLYQKWGERWTGVNDNDLTWIGKLMLKSKQNALRKILDKIKPASAIDVGCALGYTLSIFQELGIKNIGIDISPNAIAICQKKGLNAIEKKLEDVTEKYDFVFSDGMLEHFLNFEPIAKKLANVSTDYVCITQTDHGTFAGKTSIYLAEIMRGGQNVLEYNYRIGDFVDIFKKNGCTPIIQKQLFGGIFQIIVFKKTTK